MLRACLFTKALRATMGSCIPPGVGGWMPQGILDLVTPVPFFHCFSNSFCLVWGLGFSLLMKQDPHVGESLRLFTLTLPLLRFSTQHLAFVGCIYHYNCSQPLNSSFCPSTLTPCLRAPHNLAFPQIHQEVNKKPCCSLALVIYNVFSWLL